MKAFGLVAGLAAVVSGLAASPAVSQSQSPNWTSIMRGVDGVIVYCLASKDRDYSVELCDPLSKTVVNAFDGTSLKVVHTGVVYTGIDVKPGDRTDAAPLKQAPGMASPLVIRLLITGTRGANPGVASAITVSRPFRGAVESGASGEGVSGDLVVYESHWIAEGPRRKLVAFLLDYSPKRIRDVVVGIRSGL